MLAAAGRSNHARYFGLSVAGAHALIDKLLHLAVVHIQLVIHAAVGGENLRTESGGAAFGEHVRRGFGAEAIGHDTILDFNQVRDIAGFRNRVPEVDQDQLALFLPRGLPHAETGRGKDPEYEKHHKHREMQIMFRPHGGLLFLPVHGPQSSFPAFRLFNRPRCCGLRM